VTTHKKFKFANTLVASAIALSLAGCSDDNDDYFADTEAPVITLIGSATMNLELGSEFVDPGATVTDNVDKDLSATVDGSVDTDTSGTYI
jgi:hypothetical protein